MVPLMPDKTYEQLSKEIKDGIAQCGNAYFDVLCEVLKDISKENNCTYLQTIHIQKAGLMARDIANYLGNVAGIFLLDVMKKK
jgi:hypothetical protein